MTLQKDAAANCFDSGTVQHELLHVLGKYYDFAGLLVFDRRIAVNTRKQALIMNIHARIVTITYKSISETLIHSG